MLATGARRMPVWVRASARSLMVMSAWRYICVDRMSSWRRATGDHRRIDAGV